MTHKKRRGAKARNERRILFFLSLGLALFTLSLLTPSLKNKCATLGALITWKSSSADYRVEQLEMERARLSAELQHAGLPKPVLESHLAHIIARDPLTPHVIWIDAGTKNCTFIEKFSPICIGPHAVGLVEEVGELRSKVRLLSDPKVHPHVCAENTKVLANHYVHELRALIHDPVVHSALELVGKKLMGTEEEKLATAKLLGFDKKSCFTAEVIQGNFKAGDLLVTSGWDGIFPPGLFVGRVTCARSSSRSLEAKPSLPYHSMRAVFVLPAPP